MSEEDRPTPDADDTELEREVRARRRFSLSEAIGRAAGDLMKGASPVTRKRQAELEIRQYLEGRLADTEGALSTELLRWVCESESLLEDSYDRPLLALAAVVEQILASPERLRRLVRQTDAEWGRVHSQRPYFERGGEPPRPGDPYTLESIGDRLARLLDDLRDGVAREGR